MAEPPVRLGRATGENLCASLCGLSDRAWVRAQPEAGVLVHFWSLIKDEKSWKKYKGENRGCGDGNYLGLVCLALCDFVFQEMRMTLVSG